MAKFFVFHTKNTKYTTGQSLLQQAPSVLYLLSSVVKKLNA